MKIKISALIIAITFSLPLFGQNLKEFKKLSNLEQLCIIFSSDPIYRTGQNCDSYNPETESDKSISKDALNRDWGINSLEDLDKTLENLKDYKGKGTLSLDCQKIRKYPDKNPTEIAKLEYDNLYDALCLQFTYYMKDLVGNTESLAWNYGRALAIIRWAFALDYLTKDEALERSRYFAEEIQKSFANFEDFQVHYLLGRLQSFTDTENIRSRIIRIQDYYKKYNKAFPENLFMDSTTLDSSQNQILTFDDLTQLLATIDDDKKSDRHWIKWLIDETNSVSNHSAEECLEILDNFEKIRNTSPENIYNSPLYFNFVANYLNGANLMKQYGYEYLKRGRKIFDDSKNDKYSYKNFYFELAYSCVENSQVTFEEKIDVYNYSIKNPSLIEESPKTVGQLYYWEAVSCYNEFFREDQLSETLFVPVRLYLLARQGLNSLYMAESYGFKCPENIWNWYKTVRVKLK